MFDTNFAIVLRDDLAVWQKLNVTAFLAGGTVAATSNLVGEPYRDGVGNLYHPLPIQPIVVLAADQDMLRTIHRRALERGVEAALYIEEMFSTGHDAANREVFSQFSPESARVVGLAVRADKKLVDKVMKGAKMHP